MADSFESALESLYRAPLADFVAERKRLAAELKAGGDKATSTRVAALGRPSVSAWAVNQLWWQQRESFTALVEAATRLRRGERDAAKAHKEALATLREQAAQLLSSAGNAATESTLRRVTTTLSALAVLGGFEPDPPGALVADRDPPGFEALDKLEPTSPSPAPTEDLKAKQRAEEAERLRAEQEERTRRLVERERLSATLREAQQLQSTQQREITRLRAELETAEQGLKETQALLADIEARLASL